MPDLKSCYTLSNFCNASISVIRFYQKYVPSLARDRLTFDQLAIVCDNNRYDDVGRALYNTGDCVRTKYEVSK